MAIPSSGPAAGCAPVEAWAEVRARDRVMRYRRSGAGRVVLVLAAPRVAGPPWPELMAALVAGARVIAPELDADGRDGPDVAGRLLDFLEGLGTSNVAVVATDPYCTAAVELALGDGGQVTGVVLVPAGGGRAEAAGTLTSLARTAAVPLLVVRSGASPADAVPRIVEFVRGEG